MPKMLSDGNRKLMFVPTVADVSTPTAAELNAGVDLTCLVTVADFQLGSTGEDEINDPALCTTTNSSVPGRSNYEATLSFYRWTETAEDEAWTTFTGKGVHGYLVLRVGSPYTTAFAAADEVMVYEVVSGTPRILNAGDGGYEKFQVQFYVQDLVDERAAVAV